MKRTSILLLLLLVSRLAVQAVEEPFGKGRIIVRQVAHNAVRIQYKEGADVHDSLPDWLYVRHEETSGDNIRVKVDPKTETVEVADRDGRVVLRATRHELAGGTAQLTLASPADEHLYGLGQFQDGYADLRGLQRRLTQVNTQISIPMLLSSKGYGLLWNNYGLTELNPASSSVALTRQEEVGEKEEVEVTSTEGGKREVRERNIYTAQVDIATAGDYSLLLDVGQTMARRHHLSIDGKPVIDLQNLWLPPTASAIVHLEAGRHILSAKLTANDRPTVYYQPVGDETVLRSPVADAVDYTVFTGSADEIIATYRQLTGAAPLPPLWALGYIHCRERFHSQDELLQTARRFREERLPADVMVQDWQYWGKYGWNSMRFDEEHYPDPKQMTDSLHRMHLRLMVSVWSKIDKQSEVGKQMVRDDHYIPGTDWIDFFSPAAAAAYWQQFSRRLVPLGIDAWWQDATEPENDDLVGRRVNHGLWSGEQVRNVYPLLVNKTVYEGLRRDVPGQRPMILTRCGFAGIQRYGTALWSGDVGNDWETLRRQITAGLGMQAAGVPWWTYDAGGFFRPSNQYTDPAYIERMLRWIETSVFLPLMRVHGYMSDTEPWRYGAEAQRIIADNLLLRYRLLPYLYSHAAKVTFEGSTLMRPLVFDFADDPRALEQQQEYLLGDALLVSPVTEPGVRSWTTYLPRHAAGWYDLYDGSHHSGGHDVTRAVGVDRIPVYVKGGSILPLSSGKQYTAEETGQPMELRVYPGQDATFTLYEDDGTTTRYEQGQCSRIRLHWDDARRTLRIDQRQGSYEGMPRKRTFSVTLPGGESKTVKYNGKAKKVQF